MSQEELAQMTGISRVSISRYENGHTSPSVGHILKISKALNVSVDYLIGGDECEAVDDRTDG